LALIRSIFRKQTESFDTNLPGIGLIGDISEIFQLRLRDLKYGLYCGIIAGIDCLMSVDKIKAASTETKRNED